MTPAFRRYGRALLTMAAPHRANDLATMHRAAPATAEEAARRGSCPDCAPAPLRMPLPADYGTPAWDAAVTAAEDARAAILARHGYVPPEAHPRWLVAGRVLATARSVAFAVETARANTVRDRRAAADRAAIIRDRATARRKARVPGPLRRQWRTDMRADAQHREDPTR